MTNGKWQGFAAGDRRPEVLFVCASFQIGGTERHLLSVVESLVRRGWKISVYALSGAGELRAAFEAAGAKVMLPPCVRLAESSSRLLLGISLVSGAARLYLVLRRRSPEIVHFFLPKSYLVGAPVALLARVPIKIMSRRSLNDYRIAHPVLWRLERPLHRRMTAILGNSRSVIAQLRNDEGAGAERLALIYNGIDTHAFRESIRDGGGRAALGLSPNALALIIVANLIAYKGHADLLRALAQARLQLPPDWRLFIVGRDDGIGNDLRAQVKATGLQEHIVFLGARKDVPALLSACDIGLLSSHEEGFSNAILEGMAAGLPMIVTDVGGNREAVIDGETGLIVPPRGPQRLAEAIIRLAGDPALRVRLGESGKRRIAEHFTLDQCVSGYERLYHTLLQGGQLCNIFNSNMDSAAVTIDR